jgi:hypothetical protein
MHCYGIMKYHRLGGGTIYSGMKKSAHVTFTCQYMSPMSSASFSTPYVTFPCQDMFSPMSSASFSTPAQNTQCTHPQNKARPFMEPTLSTEQGMRRLHWMQNNASTFRRSQDLYCTTPYQWIIRYLFP